MSMSAESDEQEAKDVPETAPEPTSTEPEIETTPGAALPDPTPEAASEPSQPEPKIETTPAAAPPEPTPEAPATEASMPPVTEVETVADDEAEAPATEISVSPAAEVEPEVATEIDEETPGPAPKPKKQRRQLTREPRKNQPTLQQVTARFAGCGRCSYFWAGYRVIHGMAELETAVAHSKSGWLELVWDLQMPELVHKTYGVRLDISHFHYEGCCRECRRHFIYEAAENEDEAHGFRIEITPRTSK